MKRTVSIILLFSMVLGFSAFQCSSTELTSAKLYIQQNNYDKAMESLEKEVQKNPKSDEGFYLLGFINGEKGNVPKMLENFDQSLKISNKFEKNIIESKKYHWADNFNKGVQLFNKGAKAGDTDSAKIIFDQSIEKFNNAIACEPDSADTYLNLAYAHLNKGDRDAAIVSFKKIVDLTNSAESYAQLGEIYLQKGVEIKEAGDKEKGMDYFNQAIGVLEKGRKEHPANGDILLLLSNSYIAAEKLDVAKDAFKAGVEQEPENKIYRYNYGSLLLNANEYPEAEVQLKKAIELDANYENALYNLAVTYVKWGATIREDAEAKETKSEEYKTKFEAALPLLEKFLTLNEKEGAVWDLLGKVYANLGMGAKSEEAFKKADMYK
ncbi:MAG: tetratricopeptide repeat protein [Ignavibacteriae bacterium]|nr:tetratricopeptide repeat protein [Ignavibacteriota bacterium]